MDYQIYADRYYFNKQFQFDSSSSYYNLNRFPAKISFQHFLTAKKLKYKADDIRRQFQQSKQLSIQKIKQKLCLAQKSQRKFSSQNANRRPNLLGKKIKTMQDIQLIPSLSIERQPIRSYKQCKKYIPKQQTKSAVMYIRKKKSDNKIITPLVSKSMQITMLTQDDSPCHITQVAQQMSKSVFKKKRKSKANGKIKHMLKIKQSSKNNANDSKRTNKSQDNIKGWDIKYQIKDEETNLFEKF